MTKPQKTKRQKRRCLFWPLSSLRLSPTLSYLLSLLSLLSSPLSSTLFSLSPSPLSEVKALQRGHRRELHLTRLHDSCHLPLKSNPNFAFLCFVSFLLVSLHVSDWLSFLVASPVIKRFTSMRSSALGLRGAGRGGRALPSRGALAGPSTAVAKRS